MRKILILITTATILIIAGCSGGSKDSKGALADLKKKLEAKKKEQKK